MGQHPASPVGPSVKRLPDDGFVYSGNPHDSVPRKLLLDRRLTPLERNTWQVIRLLLQGDGITTLPTYEHLRPYLATSPCAAQASCETVARALTLLRLSRWLSLVRRRQPGNAGQWQGNMYVLHDEPLSPSEALHLDADYLELVSQSLVHASKALQRVAYQALQELAEDPLLATQQQTERLQRLAHCLGDASAFTSPEPPLISESEVGPASDSEGTPTSESEIPSPASDSEAGRKANESARLRNPKQVSSTVLGISKSFCIPRVSDSNPLRPPPRFANLRPEEQSAALATLQRVDPTLRQAVLDEWAIRCEAGGIQRPAAYLFGIVQKALRGDFHRWAARAQPATAPSALPPMQDEAQRAVAQQHLAELRQLLGIR
ncbi:STY4528 family pathogenicity island replication protein [Pseudomonas sp. MWU12-2037]|uniref:STY4528 family pathogenicity island replication protein n=1 Tax=Pseudomonas sp. MWU12-2037 TaxID=2928690 RepID=UPI00200E54A9|nr:STY4528 family pathogenicity island replication protein [Pseudomonas sp. MWU12-2037]